jgi:arsenate reductase
MGLKPRVRRPFAEPSADDIDTSPVASDIEIWHNPRCSKSRETLEILQARGFNPRVREYLNRAPTTDELEQVLMMLALEPRDILRTDEEAYQLFGLDQEGVGRDELLRAMCDHPILIQRPIVIRGDKAVLGRPPSNVETLLP